MDEMTEKLQKSLSIDSEEHDTYQRYVKNGKIAARNGDMTKSLELFKLAYDIHPSDKLKGRMKMIQEAIEELAQQGSESEDEEFVNVNNSGLLLFKELCDKLYDHQKDGVAFLYGLHRDGKKGGILADDMGLGKTIQIIAFLSGMYDAELVKHTLLVMPASLMANWTKEFAKWTPGMRVKEFHGTSKAERNRNLDKIQRRGGVVITTYQMLITNWQLLSSYNGKEFHWDYVILDEAHKIKTSSTKTSKSAHAIPAKHRILLTGTPVQNNLREMWALFDFACQGMLLGTSKTFKSEYENPITRAREKDATPGERALGLKISENLMAIINPYFLRRTKQDVNKTEKVESEEVQNQNGLEDKENKNPNSASAEMPSLTRKNDLIVWTYLSAVQEDFYSQFISLDHIKDLLMTARSPLAELTILKKLCDHPRLLSARAVAQLGLEEGISSKDAVDDGESAACRIDNVSDETLISESGKLTFLVTLLERLRQEGCRTLVFSQSRKMLDIIERVLVNKAFKMMRIDGTVINLAERERRITVFQTNKTYSVFLLTTQVGGVGITLTAANRVVIFDPSWNPATDAQAVDRAYRIGQKENVVIYRLITCGTVEEKIYRRQVFKDSLIRQTTGDKKNPFRYFSRQELKELFKLEDTRSSSTQLQLQVMHAKQRRTDPQLDEHIAYLHTMEMFGVSDHDLMFSHEAAMHDDRPEDEESHVYIENRVQKAQELMKAESELKKQFEENVVSSTEPLFLKGFNIHKKDSDKRSLKAEPSYPSEASSGQSVSSPLVVDLTQSASDNEEDVQDLSNKSFGAVVHISNESEENNLLDHDAISKQKGDGDSISLAEGPEENNHKLDTTNNAFFLDHNGSHKSTSDPSCEDEDVIHVADCDAEGEDNNSSSAASLEVSVKLHNMSIHECASVERPQHQSRLSALKSDWDRDDYAEESPKVDSKVESFQGDFNLQLEDSNDLFEENDIPQEVEDEECSAVKLEMVLSRENSSMGNHQNLSGTGVSSTKGMDISTCYVESSPDASFVHSVRKKKTQQVIYDSENDDEEQDEVEQHSSSRFSPITSMASSTPKSMRIYRRSVGGNTSVASRKSFVESVVEELEEMYEESVMEEKEASGDALNTEEESIDEEVQDGEAEEASHDSESVMDEQEPSGDTLSTEAEKSMEEEELSGDTFNTEEDDESMEQERCTEDLELSSGEHMENFTHDTGSSQRNEEVVLLDQPELEYDRLVSAGKQYCSEGRFKQALDFFLKALDIKSGDPEIQLLTIQLYKRLSVH